MLGTQTLKGILILIIIVIVVVVVIIIVILLIVLVMMIKVGCQIEYLEMRGSASTQHQH